MSWLLWVCGGEWIIFLDLFFLLLFYLIVLRVEKSGKLLFSCVINMTGSWEDGHRGSWFCRPWGRVWEWPQLVPNRCEADFGNILSPVPAVAYSSVYIEICSRHRGPVLIGSHYQNTMSHKCTGLLVTQPSVSLSLWWSFSLHLVAQSSRSFLLLIHSHQESQPNSASVEEARRWG